jgi:hypothetical protein
MTLQSQRQDLLVEFFDKLDLFIALGVVDKYLHLRPSARVIVAQPTISRSRDLGHVLQEVRPVPLAHEEAFLPHHCAWTFSPLGYDPEARADVDVDEWDAELMSDLAHHPVPVVAVGVQLWASGSEVVEQVQLRHEMSILPVICEESLDADCAAVLEAELPAVQVFPSNFVHGLVHLQQSRGEAAGEFDLSGFDFYRPVPDWPCVLLFLCADLRF